MPKRISADEEFEEKARETGSPRGQEVRLHDLLQRISEAGLPEETYVGCSPWNFTQSTSRQKKALIL